MQVYAIWEDYIDYLAGTPPRIPNDMFEIWAQQASRKVDYLTQNGLKQNGGILFGKYNAEVVPCVCELAEHLFATQGRRGLKAVSVTGHSETYSPLDEETDSIVSNYLSHTGLLYRGL